ncbi:MAG TPA: DUF805 domain-containing protein [Verrucomicrobiae bacterium]
MDWKSYFSLKGRMRRIHFCIIYLIFVLITVGFSSLQLHPVYNLSVLILLLKAAIIPPSVRRIHDMGYSGWFVIGVLAVPYAVLLLLFIPPDASNEFGPDPRIAPNTAPTEIDKAP